VVLRVPEHHGDGAAFKPYTAGDFTKGECEAKQWRMVYTTTGKEKKLPGGVLYCNESDAETYCAWTPRLPARRVVRRRPQPQLSEDEGLVGARRSLPRALDIPGDA
jgi:hypothetical protein